MKCLDKGDDRVHVLYFDNHIIVVKKAAGIPTQSEDGNSVELEARSWAKKQFNKKGDVFLHALHRLDKPVSGIVLLAKTSKALERLHASFRNKQMKKTYVALVEGVIQKETGALENHLTQGEFCALESSENEPKAKLCRLTYKVLERTPFSTLLEIDLETGRYHQIRCQFSLFGHPIVGDLKYGAKYVSSRQGHIALHHQQMEFPHPVTKETLKFEVGPTRDWQEWVQDLSLFC
jgi:23S rRNA pseudouridine1911/1915/1917 synthase